jgi:flagellar basal-body rod protein FlgF
MEALMQEVLRIALASMRQDMDRMDRVALNIANIGTPGYKEDVVAMRPFVDAMDEAALTSGMAPETEASDFAGTAVGMMVKLDMHTGTIKKTGEPLDVALTGDGFFEVTTDTGPAYTRQGNFRIDPRGRLVTAQGYPVMGNNGEVYLTTRTPVIDASGNVTEPNAAPGMSGTAPGQPVAQIKIARFDEPSTMQRVGDGLMAAGTNMTVVNQKDGLLRQGSLENSNINMISEMMKMTEGVRHFETMQKVTQGYDDMMGAAIRKLGDLS